MWAVTTKKKVDVEKSEKIIQVKIHVFAGAVFSLTQIATQRSQFSAM